LQWAYNEVEHHGGEGIVEQSCSPHWGWEAEKERERERERDIKGAGTRHIVPGHASSMTYFHQVSSTFTFFHLSRMTSY
jgi:hypothetical protein